MFPTNVYVDGSFVEKTKSSGCGAIITDKRNNVLYVISQKIDAETCILAELNSIILAVKFCAERNGICDVYSDFSGAISGLNCKLNNNNSKNYKEYQDFMRENPNVNSVNNNLVTREQSIFLRSCHYLARKANNREIDKERLFKAAPPTYIRTRIFPRKMNITEIISTLKTNGFYNKSKGKFDGNLLLMENLWIYRRQISKKQYELQSFKEND